MIEGLKPYPEYRDSIAPWFGDVPSHWAVNRLGALFGERGETNERREVTNILSVLKDRGVIPYTEKGRIGNKASDDIGRYKIVQPDDLVVNCMNVIIGSLGRSRYTGCLSPVYYVLRRRDPKNDPRYLELLFQHRPFHQSLIRIGNGILAHRMRIPMEKLKAELLPLPPPDEQAAIVRFLDHANRKIDGFIRAKRKLIGLLNEQKQAIIHRAVTRGLDRPQISQISAEEAGTAHRHPSAQSVDKPLKPSGIPWLGEIPAHWEVCFLRMRYSVELGKMLDAKRITGNHLVPYLRNRDVQWDRILVEELPRMDILPSEHDRYTVRKGDLLVCEGGQVGRCAFWNDELPVCGFQKALHRVRAQSPDRDCPRFLFYQLFLCVAFGIFAADGNENTIAHLTCEKLRRHRFVFPTRDEQEQIASYLDDELKSLNTAIARTEREIALMQEYRTRLTADVVTG
ncbi:MAG TPA: restriction endonuclease subunit S, partial [Verrucomicrobiota bacterium]|nr:restriction endonuclease subunit S [Verrucomicrobiota bacterium]